MTVITSSTDAVTRTLTVVAEYEASPEQVWDVWRDPRKLEQWWGPPSYPATFTRHEFAVGGESRFFMTGPAGDTPFGWWRIDAIDEHRRIEFSNGLAGEDGEPVPGVSPLPSVVTFEGVRGGTRMTIVTTFVDLDQMDTMLGMGMQAGMNQAMGQVDAVLAAASV